MIETTISSSRARVTDGGAVYRMLEDVPLSEQIRGELRKPFFTRRWHQSTERSFWIASDGTNAVCLTVHGLCADETVAIWVSFDDYRRRDGFTLSARTLSQVIEAELGIKVELTTGSNPNGLA